MQRAQLLVARHVGQLPNCERGGAQEGDGDAEVALGGDRHGDVAAFRPEVAPVLGQVARHARRRDHRRGEVVGVALEHVHARLVAPCARAEAAAALARLTEAREAPLHLAPVGLLLRRETLRERGEHLGQRALRDVT